MPPRLPDAISPDFTSIDLHDSICLAAAEGGDVEGRRLLNRTPFEGRPRMGLRVSSNGRLLYIYVAGATIDVYDAAEAPILWMTSSPVGPETSATLGSCCTSAGSTRSGRS